MTLRQTLLGLAALCVVTAAATVARQPTVETKPTRSGAIMYRAMGCYQCHGLVGQGSVISGPALNPLRSDAEAFARYVRNPTGSMPPYTAESLSDRDLAAIEHYVRSFPRAAPYGDIPALAAVVRRSQSSKSFTQSADGTGASLYATNCAACHGADRSGGVGPALTLLGKNRSHAQIVALIKNPPPKMPKMFPDAISEREVEQIATYLEQAR